MKNFFFVLRVFLLRDSQSNPKTFVLSLCHMQKVKHFQILPVSITHRLDIQLQDPLHSSSKNYSKILASFSVIYIFYVRFLCVCVCVCVCVRARVHGRADVHACSCRWTMKGSYSTVWTMVTHNLLT